MEQNATENLVATEEHYPGHRISHIFIVACSIGFERPFAGLSYWQSVQLGGCTTAWNYFNDGRIEAWLTCQVPSLTGKWMSRSSQSLFAWFGNTCLKRCARDLVNHTKTEVNGAIWFTLAERLLSKKKKKKRLWAMGHSAVSLRWLVTESGFS